MYEWFFMSSSVHASCLILELYEKLGILCEILCQHLVVGIIL